MSRGMLPRGSVGLQLPRSKTGPTAAPTLRQNEGPRMPSLKGSIVMAMKPKQRPQPPWRPAGKAPKPVPRKVAPLPNRTLPKKTGPSSAPGIVPLKGSVALAKAGPKAAKKKVPGPALRGSVAQMLKAAKPLKAPVKVRPVRPVRPPAPKTAATAGKRTRNLPDAWESLKKRRHDKPMEDLEFPSAELEEEFEEVEVEVEEVVHRNLKPKQRTPQPPPPPKPKRKIVFKEVKARLVHKDQQNRFWESLCSLSVANVQGRLRGSIQTKLSGHGLLDEDLAQFVSWLRMHPRMGTAHSWAWRSVDVAQNQLTQTSVTLLCGFLDQFQVEVQEFHFEDNQIDDIGLDRLAQFVSSEAAPIRAIFLDNNRITAQGILWLLARISFHPMYPMEQKANGTALSRYAPLWLKADGNGITEEDLQELFSSSNFRHLGCSVCLAGSCSPGNCRQAKMTKKHNLVLHLHFRGDRQPALRPTVLASALAPAGPSAQKVFEMNAGPQHWRQPWLASAEGSMRAEPAILYEDANFMIIFKPASWHCCSKMGGPALVQRAKAMNGEQRRTCAKQLLAQQQAPPLHDYIILRFGADPTFKEVLNERMLYGLVHRLDVGTSGPLLMAKNWESFDAAKRMIALQLTVRDYIALVHGSFGQHQIKSRGLIRAPIDATTWDAQGRVVVHERGQEASTFYECLAEYQSTAGSRYSLVHFRLLTGRTHQIRVHMEYLGFPLVGDRQYQGPAQRRKGDLADRPLLHKVRFTVPTYPEGDPVVLWTPLTSAQEMCEVLGRLQLVHDPEGCGLHELQLNL
ncbi:unnamed protein product [Effrenium voratum]|uniref:Pseudouridine synthase RsuA/RluA-like domain-containing protein n=1 Tax=Effrenium voratum TaxID=2562239 RepID=A0AA36HKR1_9DINO|nr:unnamed protein product [Effrenium voratum]CAJ1456011.1 unnamed protein product [Effrenium voratum]